MTELVETKLKSEVVFQGRFLDVRRDVVELPNGKTTTREWINHPGAVVILPILPDGLIGLIRQYRYAAQGEFIELPAGKLDSGEKPLACEARELKEEIGYKAGKLTFLAQIHPAIGFSNEKMWMYLAEDLEKYENKLDQDEFLELLPTPLEKALDWIWSGKITDVKTIIGLLWAKRLLS